MDERNNIEGDFRSNEDDNVKNHWDRRNDERRKNKSEGYWYVSMVGWMDRRECGRRTDDRFSF